MAKPMRKTLSGKEARYKLQQNHINQAWLAEQLGITPQSLSSRLNATEFKVGYQLEINKITGQRIFDVDADVPSIANDANRVPVLDLRTAAGFDYVQLEDYLGNPESIVSEYVTMSGLRGCVGIYVYGDSMTPEYRSGDYLGGTNLIDLMQYDFRDKTMLEYIRTKTKNRKKSNRTVSFSIPPEAQAIIGKYINAKTGHLDFGTSGTYDTFKNIVTRDIKRIAKKSGIKDWKRCCFYTARKSFVQHGFDLGISLEVLEYCIGQSMKSDRPIFNYLKIMRRHADEAIRTIIDNLNGSTEALPPDD